MQLQTDSLEKGNKNENGACCYLNGGKVVFDRGESIELFIY